MSAASVRQRGGQKEKKSSTTPQRVDSDLNGMLRDTNLPQLPQVVNKVVTSDWDYKLALTVITIAAFITRFWGIGHPDEVVFDEVHFGKVRYFYDFVDELRVRGKPRPYTDLWLNTVCIILPAKNVLFRCASTLWQASFRPHGLVRWL